MPTSCFGSSALGPASLSLEPGPVSSRSQLTTGEAPPQWTRNGRTFQGECLEPVARADREGGRRSLPVFRDTSFGRGRFDADREATLPAKQPVS